MLVSTRPTFVQLILYHNGIAAEDPIPGKPFSRKSFETEIRRSDFTGSGRTDTVIDRKEIVYVGKCHFCMHTVYPLPKGIVAEEAPGMGIEH